jgi:hypothetical protein
MLRHLIPLSLIATLGVSLVLLPAPAPAQVGDPPPFRREDPVGPPPAVPGDPEVQARGPVHEAFAMPAEGIAKAGPAIPKAPPEPIPEAPPEEAPQGEGVIWVPGYWAWDEDRSDFIWVSGIWRIAPPGRKWVPGYWSQTDAGNVWVSGFWAPTGVEELPYQEAPPAPLNLAPSLPAPDEFSTFVPGIWLWRERWLWRPGYWLDPRPDWVYCPPRWCWTPRGYLFCSGYWDRPLVGRGLLFAPVWFGRARPALFTPRFVVGVNPLVNNLWIRPGFGYAFGDFYGVTYARRGFTPWVTAGPRVRDPLFDHYRYVNRANPRWANSLAADVNNRFREETARPARTLALQERTRGPAVVERLDRYRPEGIRMTRLDESTRKETRRVVETVQKTATDRRTLEARTTDRPRSLPTRDIPAPRPTAPPRFEGTTPKGPATPTTTRPIPPTTRPDTPKTPTTPGTQPTRPERPKGETPKNPPRIDPPKGPTTTPPRIDPPKGPTITPPRTDTPKTPPRVDPPRNPVTPPRGDLPRVDPPRTPTGTPPKTPPTVTPPSRTPSTPPRIEPPRETRPATPPRIEPSSRPGSVTPPSSPPPVRTPPATPPSAAPRNPPPAPRYTPPAPRSSPPSRPAAPPSRPGRPGGR